VGGASPRINYGMAKHGMHGVNEIIHSGIRTKDANELLTEIFPGKDLLVHCLRSCMIIDVEKLQNRREAAAFACLGSCIPVVVYGGTPHLRGLKGKAD